jgi:hypothetical protein
MRRLRILVLMHPDFVPRTPPTDTLRGKSTNGKQNTTS